MAEKGSEVIWNVPLTVLQQYTCSKCYNYLTVLPVTVNVELNALICGRESCKKFISDSDQIDTIINFLFENNSQFRCINHYGGCSVIVNSSNAEDHENWCIYREKKECPFCSTLFIGTWVQILSHTKQNHSDRILKDNTFYSFTFEPDLKSLFIYPDEDGNISLISVTSTEDDFLVKVTWCNNKLKTRQVEKTYNNSVIFASAPNDSKKCFTKELTTNLLISRKELLKHFEKIDDTIYCKFEINLVNELEAKKELMKTYEKKTNQLLEGFAKLSMSSNSHINPFAALEIMSPHKCPVNGCFKILSTAKLFIEHWHHTVKLVYNKRCLSVGHNKRNSRVFWLIENDLYKLDIVMEEVKNLLTITIDEINAKEKCRNWSVGCSYGKIRGRFKKYDVPAVQSLPGKWMYTETICKSPYFNIYHE